jgi:hypothetical protein
MRPTARSRCRSKIGYRDVGSHTIDRGFDRGRTLMAKISRSPKRSCVPLDLIQHEKVEIEIDEALRRARI